MIARLLLFGAVWLALTGELSLANALLGLAFAGAVIWVVGAPAAGSTIPLRRLHAVLSLAAYFLYELTRSSLRVAYLVLRPRLELQPAILRVPIGLTRDWEITLLANLITLTPGSMTVEVAEDRRSLFVHVVDGADAELARREIREGFEARIRRLGAGKDSSR